MKGIDISVYQMGADWKKVKNSGIEFAMIKASQGGGIRDKGIAPFEDRGFAGSVAGASSVGIKCGAYHFMTGTTRDEVLEEAEFFIKTVKKAGSSIIFPCAADMEDERYTRFDREYNASLLKIFCGAVYDAGYIPMVYTNRAFSVHFINMKMLKGYDVWFALYRKSGDKGPVPQDVSDITVWQWGTEKIDGIKGNVDMNIGYKDYARLRPIRIGDIVTLKKDAIFYYPGGPKIPDWVKGKNYGVAKTQVSGKDIVKGGEKCVLLGEYIDENGNAQGNIMTWTAVSNLETI